MEFFRISEKVLSQAQKGVKHAALDLAVAGAVQPAEDRTTIKMPTVSSARQRMLFQPEQTAQADRWYKGESPTSSEMAARIYSIGQSNPTLGKTLWSDFERFQNDPTSPIYDPYRQSTNKAAAELSKLGFDMSGGITQQWIQDNAWLKGHYRTATGTSPLAPSSSSTPEQDAAYWYYKAVNAEETTQKAETEWEALQEELAYWVDRKDRNYSDEEVLARIDWGNYPTLKAMDEGRKKGVPLALNRGVGYSQDTLNGVLWAARNRSTGDAWTDSVQAALGRGNVWQENTDISRMLDPTSDAYSPYAAGSTLDDAALYFGVPSFDSDWLEKNRSYLASDDATAREMYQKVYDAEQKTREAEDQLAALQEAMETKLSYGSGDPEWILSDLQEELGSTLKSMDDSRRSGDLLGLTRAVNYRWEDIEAEVRQRCEEARKKPSVGENTEQLTGRLGLSKPHTESDKAVTDAKDAAVRAATHTIVDVGTDEEKVTFQTTHVNQEIYLQEISEAITNGTADPQTSFGFCLDRANAYAGENYLGARTVVGQYEQLQKASQDALEELNKLQDEWGDLTKLPEAPTLAETVKSTVTVDGRQYVLHAQYDDKAGAYVFTEAVDNGTGARANLETVNAEGQAWAKTISDRASTVSGQIKARDAAIARVGQLSTVIAENAEYLKAHQAEYAQNKVVLQRISESYGIVQRMAALDPQNLSVQAEDVRRTQEILDAIYTIGAEYRPTEWTAHDLYSLAMEEGSSYQDVARSAKAGRVQNETALKNVTDLLKWMDENRIKADNSIRSNLEREAVRLEREIKAADYFMLQGREDFKSASKTGIIPVFGSETDMHLRTHMTDTEWDTYRYLYTTEGREAAAEYFDFLTDETYGVLTVRNSQESQKFWQQFAEDHPVGSSVLSVIASPLQLEGTGYAMLAGLSGKDINPYHAAFGAGTAISTIRGTVKEDITANLGEGTFGAWAGNVAYDVFTAAGDSMVNAALFGGANLGSEAATSALGKFGLKATESFISAAPMGLQAASSAIQDAKERGAEDWQAFAVGGATFMAETLSEAITVDNIKNAFKSGADGKKAKSFLKKLFKDGMEEGVGEAASEYITGLSDELIMGKLSNHQARVEAYCQQGMNQLDAEAHAYRDFLKDALYSGFVGALSGDLSTTISYVAGKLGGESAQNQDLAGVKNTGANADRMRWSVDDAMGMPADSASQQVQENADAFVPDDSIDMSAFADQAQEADPNSTPETVPESAEQSEAYETLLKQLTALTQAEGAEDAATTSAVIGAVLAPQGASGEASATASAVGQHLVQQYGKDRAPAMVSDALVTAAENDIPQDQLQTAFVMATLGAGQAAKTLSDIADSDAGITLEGLHQVLKAAHNDMQDPAAMTHVQQVVTDSRIAARTKALIADGALDGIRSYETAVQQSRMNLQNAREGLKQASRQQESAAKNLQDVNGKFNAEPGNQMLRGAFQQAVKDAEGAAKVVMEYRQSVTNAEADLQAAKTTLKQQRESAMKNIRQQAMQEVARLRAQQREAEAVMAANAETAAANVEQNIQAVAEMAPVAALEGDEFVMGPQLKEQVLAFFREVGSVVNPEIGEIALTRRGVKSSFGHGMTPAKAVVFAVVPDVLKNGKVIDAQKNWQGRSYDTVVVAAPVSIADQGEGICAVIVKRVQNGQNYYLHEVGFVNENRGEIATGFNHASDTKPRQEESSNKTHPIDNILDRVLDVKRRKMGKGEPTANSSSASDTEPRGAEISEQTHPDDSIQDQTEDANQQDGTPQSSNMQFSKVTPQQQPQGVSSTPKGAPKQSPARIAKDLVKALGLGDAVGTKRMNHVPQAVAGYYETRAKYIAVRSSQAGNYTVTMHEVFHSLAERLNMTGTQDMVNNLDPVFAASYDPAELPGEAFAEFGWRYMEDEALARQFAGDAFVDQFEARLRRAGLDKTIHKAAQQLRTWLNATVNERIGATIVDKSKAAKPEGWRAQLRALISQHIDDTSAAEPVNAAIREATGQNRVPLNQDVRANALMKNFASRRAYAILTENMTDASWNVTGESLAARFERVGLKAKDAKLLDEYMLALHSLDRDVQNKPVFDMVSITPAQRQQLIDDVQQNHPEVAAAEQEFQAFRKEFLQSFLVDTGFLSQADFDTMNGMYPHYVPTLRVKDGGKSNRGNSKTYRIRRATGSTEDIINPMDSFVSMVDSVVTMVSANNAALAWDNAYRQNESLGAFGREITPDMHQVSVNVSELQSQIAQLLAGHTDADVFQQVIDLVGTRQTQWVPQSGTNMANVVTVQRADGSLGYYEMFEPELYKLLASQRDGSGSSNKLWATLGKITRTMSMLTTGSNPVFAVRNFMRDFQNSVNYGSWASNYGTGLAKWLRASYGVWRKSGEYQDYVALGGGGWTRIEAGTKKGASDYRSALYKGYNTSTVRNAAKWAGEKAWNTLTFARLNEVIEQTSRFAEYKYGQHDKTTSEGKAEAFLAAQDVTVDFARMGNSGTASVLKQLIPFLGASMQGVYRTGRSVTQAERSRSVQRFTKTVVNTALVSTISAAIMLKYSNDEEKEAFALMSDDLKSQHLYFPNIFKDVLGQQPLIRIPLAQDPLTYAIHGAMTNAMWSGTTDEMVIDLAAIANTIVDNLNPFGSGTVFEPMLAVGRNRNWYGSRIVPSYMDGWDVTTQYTEETPGLFVFAGRALGMSPLNVQYLAEQYSGFLGQMAIPALSKDSSGELGGWEATRTAIQKRFTSDPLISNDVVSCVYDNAAFLTQVTSAAKNGRPANMLRRGLTEEEQKAAYDEAYTLTHKGGVIADAKTFISDGYARIEAINVNDTLTPEQKYTLTSEIRREMIQVALGANEAAAGYKEKYVSGLNIASNALYEGSYLAIPTAMDKMDPTFKADSSQTYMQRATAVWEATGNDSALPHPNTSYTSSGVTYTVDEADMDNWLLQYKMGYQEYLVKKGGMWDGMTDGERLEILKAAHSAGHNAAKEWHKELHGIE